MWAKFFSFPRRDVIIRERFPVFCGYCERVNYQGEEIVELFSAICRFSGIVDFREMCFAVFEVS